MHSNGLVNADQSTSPLQDARPLLLRLEHGVHFTHDDQEKLQPRVGAEVVVRRHPGAEVQRVWLSAAAWEGVGTLVRQTPDHSREGVATLLEVLHSAIPASDAIYALLGEIIEEVRNDPYGHVAEPDRSAYAFHW